MEKKQTVSRAVVGRLPRYYRYVSALRKNGVQRVSSRAMAEAMGLTASQIRQDFNCFGGFGQQGYGYQVEKLYQGLSEILGLNRQRTAILVGAGNLGRALLKNFDFNGSGFKVLYAFDADKTVVGCAFGGVRIRDVSEMYDFVSLHKPDLAVLTLSAKHAPEVAQRLVDCGIKGLWNFTGDDIYLENTDVPIENMHFSDNLMTLCYQINYQADGKAEED